ncbi:MAG: hypothetical protein OQK35_03215 [Alphaproteobacteria bacterium]|nr:hypothetical protein [Rhodospirillales bacterium]MCW9045321.1 hypothetical protein [Alphaproteobacteria bacterium]
MGPARWGQARIEIGVLREEVLEGLKNGTPISHVYNDLKSDGRLTISLKVFYKWVKRLRSQTSISPTLFNSSKASRSAQTPQALQSVSPDQTPSRRPAAAKCPNMKQSQVISQELNELTDMTSASFEQTWDGEINPENTERKQDHGLD